MGLYLYRLDYLDTDESWGTPIFASARPGEEMGDARGSPCRNEAAEAAVGKGKLILILNERFLRMGKTQNHRLYSDMKSLFLQLDTRSCRRSSPALRRLSLFPIQSALVQRLKPQAEPLELHLVDHVSLQ